MIIYIDNDYKCHKEYAEGLIAVEIDFFEGKCKEFIEGYRCVPAAETWIREDGVKFAGEMISPWVSHYQLEKIQLVYEKESTEEALNILIGGE